MRIFVTGGSGFIGWNIIKSMKKNNDVHWTYLNHACFMENTKHIKLDITNFSKLREHVKEIKPELIVHTVAIPSVDICENDHNYANKVNIEGTKNIIELCKNTSNKIVFISTAAVFSGLKNVYFEDDLQDPINYYGYTKAEGEKIIINSGIPYLITRIDQPYGWIESWQKKNSVVRALESLSRKETLRDIIDWFNTPVFIDDIVNAILKLLEKDKEGIYNVVGPDFINRYEWSKKIANIFGYDESLIEAIGSKELNLPAKRPNVRLNNEKVTKDIGMKMHNIKEGLLAMKGKNNQI